MTKSLAIYQSFHKEFPRNSACNWIIPVGVNGYQGSGFQSDASGENISQLNPYYCELTAQYWAWKNTTSDYVGFCHYRRYFNFIMDNTWTGDYAFSTPATESIIGYLTSEQQLQALHDHLSYSDVVIPKKTSTPKSIEGHYLHYHISDHWHYFTEVLKTVYPDYANHTKMFEVSNLNTAYNMFVMSRPLFHKYCEDLFQIIDLIYQKFGAPYDSYNNRYPGFIAERFLGFWLQINRLRISEVALLKLD